MKITVNSKRLPKEPLYPKLVIGNDTKNIYLYINKDKGILIAKGPNEAREIGTEFHLNGQTTDFEGEVTLSNN